MADGLYEHDILAWSQRQADLLRRLGQGERVNEVDWVNLAEEIEGVGLSELHTVESHLTLVMVHLLKIQAWPDSPAIGHWLTEIITFQTNALRRFTPSMRQRIDLDSLYADAVRQARAGDRRANSPRPWPEANPFTLDQLLRGETDDLIRRLCRPNPA